MDKGNGSVVGIGVVMAALIVIAPLVFVVPAVARSAEWHVYPNESIQAAVDAATSGDIIYVHPGFGTTYNEEVRINKSVTIIAVEEWVQTGWDSYGNPEGLEMRPQLVGDPNIFVITDCSELRYLALKGDPVSNQPQRESVPALTPLSIVALVVLLMALVVRRISRR